MKTSVTIIVGSSIIAAAIYLGLTHDKRSYMDYCLKKHIEEACEASYRAK